MKFGKIASLFMALMLLSSCGSKDSENFVVATSADNPPYEFSKDGKVVGFDIDFAEALAAKMGKKLEIRNMDFNGLIPALTGSRIDAVIAGISVTEERKEAVDFSNVYSESRVAILSKKISEINSTESLKDKRVGVQLGTTWESIVKKMAEATPSINIMTMTNNLALVEELKNDRIVAVVLEKTQAEKFLEKYPELSVFLMDEEHASHFAVVLEKKSKHLDAVNKAIDELKKDGVIENLQNKWLK